MSSAPPVSWQNLPLHGRSLVEASAGTGKTWTISVLYLRLLLERELGARQIVVTTFTEAAAQELRERLRARLDWAAAYAAAWRDGGHAQPRDDDEAPELVWLHDLLAREEIAADGRPQGAALHRLRLARAELDLAPIGTIHSLCRRVLADHPFDAGAPVATPRLVAEDSLRSELVDDLWRNWTQNDAPLQPGQSEWIDSGRAALSRALRALELPQLQLSVPDPASIDGAMDPGPVKAIRKLAARKDFFGRSNAALITELLALADFLERGDPAAVLRELKHLGGEPTANQFKAGLHAAALADPTLIDAMRVAHVLQHKDRIRRNFALARAHAQLCERRAQLLAQRDQFTFDDLIAHVCRAVCAPDATLATRLSTDWQAALIDECQDTDPRQYAIFDTLFSAPFAMDTRCLILIGDPKQAIYAFRGGDIHTYLRAARDADQHLTLEHNQRSSTRYIAALNQFYAAVVDGLLDPDIRYIPVHAAGRADATPYSIDHQRCERPLVIHAIDSLALTPPNAPERERYALEACADEIVQLLAQGNHRIGDKPIEAGDIAVLLPQNRQIETLRRLLARRRVPCVGSGRSSVWDSEWAWALQAVLFAVVHPQDDGAVRAALATRLFGFDHAKLRALVADEPGWRVQAARFHQLQVLWRDAGVLAVVRQLGVDAAPQLLAAADGERALTDLRHLGELLAAEGERLHGPEPLWAWLVAQRTAEGAADEEALDAQRLRIESDARRVQLMTLHASKGLEFSIVFLPLMWAHCGRDIKIPIVHDAAIGAMVADLGTPAHDEAVALAESADQRERARVLYVALTRAKYACHLFALPVERPQSGNKAPLADPQRSALDALLERWQQRKLPAASVCAIEWRGDWPGPPTVDMPSVPNAPLDSLPLPMPAERPYRGQYSFTHLLRAGARIAASDDAAADETAATVVNVAEDESVGSATPHSVLLELDAIGGADFGNAVHAVFERRALGQPVAEQLPLVRRCLQEYGVRSSSMPFELLAARVAARVDATLAADLGAGLRLGALGPQQQRAELGFDFVLEGSSLARLREACAVHGDPGLLPAALGGRSLRGMMTGKIDLVLQSGASFHVLDYKTNRLGMGLSDYAGQHLDAAMDAHAYRLQALLYSIALHRHLRQQLRDYDPARHLGDAIYLFVRAVGLAPGHGVWRRAFPLALIDAVDGALAHIDTTLR